MTTTSDDQLAKLAAEIEKDLKAPDGISFRQAASDQRATRRIQIAAAVALIAVTGAILAWPRSESAVVTTTTVEDTPEPDSTESSSAMQTLETERIWYVVASRGRNVVRTAVFSADVLTLDSGCSSRTISISPSEDGFTVGPDLSQDEGPLDEDVICISAGVDIHEGQEVSVGFGSEDDVVLVHGEDDTGWQLRLAATQPDVLEEVSPTG